MKSLTDSACPGKVAGGSALPLHHKKIGRHTFWDYRVPSLWLCLSLLMQFGAERTSFLRLCWSLHFQVFCTPNLCVFLGIYVSPGVSRAGEAFITCGVTTGGASPSQSLPALWKGNAASRMCWGCCAGVCVNVWLLSAGNCKTFSCARIGKFCPSCTFRLLFIYLFIYLLCI